MVHRSQNPRQKAVEILSSVLGENKPLKMLLTDDVLSRFNMSDRVRFIS